MSETDRAKLVGEIIIRAISIGTAIAGGRGADVVQYTDEIRQILREALAE